MAALRSRCGHYILPRGFFFFFFLFFSPNLSRQRLDVYHTSTHGVALVRIQNGSLEMQDPKNRHLGTFPQLGRAISSRQRHISTIGNKLVKQQYLLHMCLQYGELGLLAADIVSLVWGTPANFNGFRIWQRYCTALRYWASAKLCGVEQRRHLYLAGRPSRWALAHISSLSVHYV